MNHCPAPAARIRFPSLLIPTALALALSACGGGGGLSPGGSGLSATLARTTGTVDCVDGQTTAVMGITLRVPATGSQAVTGPGGSFDLGDLPQVPTRIDVTVPAGGAVTQKARADDTAGEDTAEFEVDLSGHRSVSLHLEIEGGIVTHVRMESCNGGRGSETCEPLTSTATDITGKVCVEQRAAGDVKLEIEAHHLATGRQVRFVVLDPASDAEVDLGVFTADGEGEVEAELETEHGAELPFGATTADELAGLGIEVRDADTGEVLLEGTVPSAGDPPLPCGDDADDDHSGHGEDDGMEHDGMEHDGGDDHGDDGMEHDGGDDHGDDGTGHA